jgi:prepilin-type N-terminal cleavage/methylation domain-containing protein
MQKHPTHKNASGFTLIELVIAVAVIGILTSVAVLGYNQYKVRAYDIPNRLSGTYSCNAMLSGLIWTPRRYATMPQLQKFMSLVTR